MGYTKRPIFFCAIFLSVTLLAAKQTERKEFNRLNWAEISKNRLSTQIMFDFAAPVYCQPKLIKETRQLLISFPGMNLDMFNTVQIMPQFIQLKEKGFIKHIEIYENNTPVQTVMLSLEFAAYRNVKDTENNQTKQKNRFIIKWSTLESPYRLIIDIFLREDLEKISQKDAVLLYASNDRQQYDISLTNNAASSQKKKQRIIIDPGHGGSDTGAKGYYGLVEKNVALDISRRVYAMLKKKGYSVMLTRHDDCEMPLVERSALAAQLEADLFISIHLNSSGTLGSSAWGIETFYLNNKELQVRNKKTGFLFYHCKKDVNVIKKLDGHLKDTMNKSKQLAQTIQQHLLSTFQKREISVVNRGIKPEKFRIFLQSGIPTALVEVGFVTHPEEAKRLSKSRYREFLAYGIYQGIRSYLSE